MQTGYYTTTVEIWTWKEIVAEAYGFISGKVRENVPVVKLQKRVTTAAIPARIAA